MPPNGDRADHARRAGRAGWPGAPAGRQGPAGRSVPRGAARSEVCPQQRAVRDLRRVDRVVPDLRVRHGRCSAAAACRRCSSRAGSPRRRPFRRARPAARGTRPPLPATAAARAFACVPLSQVCLRAEATPGPRPIPFRSRSPYASLTGRDERQHGLEVLARSPAGSPVDMALEAVDEPEPASPEDLGVQVATIVDDDASRARRARATLRRRRSTREMPATYSSIARPARATRGRTELALAAVVEPEQLVRVAMLLVVVDQPRVRRRRDDRVERPLERDVARSPRARSRRRDPGVGPAGTP